MELSKQYIILEEEKKSDYILFKILNSESDEVKLSIIFYQINYIIFMIQKMSNYLSV